MTGCNDWQALQYVLDDPTLDRDATEVRMQSDVDFALAVAEAVQFVELVRTAELSRTTAKTEPVSVAVHTAKVTDATPAKALGWHWSSVAGLAAALLLAIGVGLHRLELPADGQRDHSTNDPIASNSRPVADPYVLQEPISRQFIAERWLAIRSETLALESLDLGNDALAGGDDAYEAFFNASANTNAASTSGGENNGDEEEDWMLEAAREFYTQGVAS